MVPSSLSRMLSFLGEMWLAGLLLCPRGRGEAATRTPNSSLQSAIRRSGFLCPSLFVGVASEGGGAPRSLGLKVWNRV